MAMSAIARRSTITPTRVAMVVVICLVLEMPAECVEVRKWQMSINYMIAATCQQSRAKRHQNLCRMPKLLKAVITVLEGSW